LQAPRGLLDKIRAKNIPVTESEEINDGLSADIFYTNRLQQERFADPEEFEQQRKKLTLTADMLSSHSVLVMDPLPRVDEIHPSVDNLPNALYFKQAKNGLYARMALLEYLLAG